MIDGLLRFLEPLLARCVAFSPEARASADEIVAALEQPEIAVAAMRVPPGPAPPPDVVVTTRSERESESQALVAEDMQRRTKRISGARGLYGDPGNVL